MPAVAYIEDACEKLEEFEQRVIDQLPKRINQSDVIEIFKKNGFMRSYTLREQIVGRRLAPAKSSQKDLKSTIPTPSPPKRG